MQAIPEQIAVSLSGHATIRLGMPVGQVAAGGLGVRTADGETIPASAVVIASDGEEAQRLLGADESSGGVRFSGWRCAATLYFAADRPPVDEPILVLDGDGRGPVNHLCVPSQVAPSYAPPGASLISANIVGEPSSGWAGATTAVIDQLRGWFGSQVDRWRHLRTYRILHALPDQPPGSLEPPQRPVRCGPGLYVCGDHRDNASINGAMHSGRRAAEALLADLGRGDA
jgi:phytoene dehydrogenase-like protein